MNINRNNYESYFLDYFDGNLNSEQVEQLFVFLSDNNDLKNEFDDFENLSLCPDNVKFPSKKGLKKQLINPETLGENFNKFCVDKIEGNLSNSEEKLFDDYLKKNSDKQQDFILYKKTILKPDLSVKFVNKQELKRFNFNKDFEQACIAYIENDLSKVERNRFKEFLNQNPEYRKEYNLFRKTILEPNKIIIYEDKMLLKKHFVSKINKVKTIFSYVSAAAAVVLFFFAFSYYQNLLKRDNGVMSNVDSADNRVSFSNSAAIINAETNREKYFYVEDRDGSAEKQIGKKTQIVRAGRQKVNIKPIQTFRNIQFANNYDKNIIVSPKTYSLKKYQEQQYNTVSQAIAQKFTEKVIKPENASKNISLWDLAKAGLRAINNLTGSKMELEKQCAQNDNMEILAFNSRNFDFSTKIKKSK